MTYLTIKALHVAFMVTWFAALFYLPRLFIYHRAATDEVSLERFVVMERRLYAMMTLGFALTLVLGLALVWMNPGLFSIGWFHVKLVLLLGLIGYHFYCKRIMRELAAGTCTRSDKWLRFYNEVPVVFLLAIIILAVTKPF